MYVFIIICLLLIFLALIGFYFSGVIIHPKKYTHEDSYKIELDSGRIKKEQFESLYKEEVEIRSPYEYTLRGWYFPVEGADKTVIICHGITYTLYGSIKYMDLFMKRGFNVLLYDHRNHGISEGNNTTFGYYEKQDLKAWSDWVFEKQGEDHIVGILGESMGAATVLQNAAIDPRITFYIADCPYSDMYEQLKYRLQIEYHLPPFPMLPIANIFMKLRTGIGYKAVSPIEDIKNVETPILWIHGENDDYVPTWMSQAMYEQKQAGYKKIYIAPNAAHAEAYWKNEKEYDQVVEAFLKEIDVI